MFRHLIYFYVFLLCSYPYSIDNSVHSMFRAKPDPTLSQILKNRPDIDKSYAKQVSNSISRVADKYNLNPKLLTAILMQESRYRVQAVSSTNSDFGISQIHKFTVNRYKFNKKRLISDIDYSVEAGAIVLKDFYKRYAKEPKWWTRFNSSNKIARARYAKLVERWL